MSQEDAYFALDKLGHVLFCAAATTAGFYIALNVLRWKNNALGAGIALGCTVGIVKEAGDVLGVRQACSQLRVNIPPPARWPY
jgi:hypothetical protein